MSEQQIHMRAYRDDEPIEIGDVVRLKGDTGAFSTCIVVDVVRWHVLLERPHVLVTTSRMRFGTAFTAFERWRSPLETFKAKFEVFVTGASGNKDNRGKD